MEGQKKVLVFGASNIDIIGFPKSKLVIYDSNKGLMKISSGGVGRNIAHNLSLLGFDVQLVSLFGDDPFSKYLIKDCLKNRINISKSLVIKNANVSSFIAILNQENDLQVGISAMEIYNNKNSCQLVELLPQETDMDYIIVETNYTESSLKELMKKFPRKKIILDTVSADKAQRAAAVLKNLYILKTNLLEAQKISGFISDDAQKLVQYFLDKGVKKVFITLGEHGVAFGETKQIYHKKSMGADIINTIGAGDAFVSGLILADSLSLPIDKMADFGMAAASLTVQCHEAVCPDLSYKSILSVLKKNKK